MMKRVIAVFVLVLCAWANIVLADDKPSGMLKTWRTVVHGVWITITFKEVTRDGDLVGRLSSGYGMVDRSIIARRSSGGYVIELPNDRGYDNIHLCGSRLCTHFYRQDSGGQTIIFDEVE